MTANIQLPAIINGVCDEIAPQRGGGAPLRRTNWRRRADQSGTILSHIEATRAYAALRATTSARRFNQVNLEA